MQLRKLAGFDISSDMFKFLDTSKIKVWILIQLIEDALFPSAPFYFDTIYKEVDPENDVDLEARLSQNAVYQWLCLRTLSQNTIEPFRLDKNF